MQMPRAAARSVDASLAVGSGTCALCNGHRWSLRRAMFVGVGAWDECASVWVCFSVCGRLCVQTRLCGAAFPYRRRARQRRMRPVRVPSSAYTLNPYYAGSHKPSGPPRGESAMASLAEATVMRPYRKVGPLGDWLVAHIVARWSPKRVANPMSYMCCATRSECRFSALELERGTGKDECP